MPTKRGMAHHAPKPGSAGALGDRNPGRGEALHERALPELVARRRDELFEDADRHGPRATTLAWRVAPALVAMLVAVALTTAPGWRGAVIAATSDRMADLLLVLPVLVAIVALGAAIAPLARIRVEPLLGAGLVLLAAGGWLVLQGLVVLAMPVTVAGALCAGVAAARAVRRAVWALPLLLAAGVSDAQSVAFGVTDRLLEGTVEGGTAQVAAATTIPVGMVDRLDLLVVHVPVATGTWLLGIVDVVAIGMLLGLAHLYWRSLPKTGACLAGALAAAVAIGSVVPVLPMLGVAWVVANAPLVWRSTRFSLRRLTYLGG